MVHNKDTEPGSGIRIWMTELSDQLGALADPVRAPEQKRYLKSPYKFYGVRKPLIDNIAKTFVRSTKGIVQEEVHALCSILWKAPFHEQKSLAISLLQYFDQKWDASTIDLVDVMIDEVTGWDHLDELAIHVLGPLIHGGYAPVSYLRKCSASENFWKRRASLIAQITFLRKGAGNIDLHLELCRKHIGEREFFIRKAIGWSLRELGKTRPELVYDFLNTYRDDVSGLTFREASRNLPADMKKGLR
jgi:3-methyladenine DNA glycosylase AlkD